MDAPAEVTANPLRQLVKGAMTRVVPSALFRVRESAGERGVYLTFDDGPHPEHTPKLLDAMAAVGARGTFFVRGDHAAEHPDIVRRIVDEGHALGHHSFSHGEPGATSAGALAAEVQRTLDLFQVLLNRSSTLFRPPHGKVTPGKLARLWAAGQSIVLWNVDPKDFAKASVAELRAWLEAHPLDAGDIVLLHDTHPHAAGVMPFFAERARAAGLSLLPLRR
jgi:peptidoglycan/xylan/chitin deacetylase (PgdA/CDA1 family)